ncbi:MAG: inorganic diphosphatase [Candidatus Marsarchaeota archaeon]|jgi:inorganic pyrophosphatase|nr:inorganic diphosphatase [Candidatus Marsarchaeota archaeon]MCL5418462.1 inorganic diphosphatase [Candidatus Marsarchaeota archaeon]
MRAYIEMEAGSRVKHVFNEEKNELLIHRLLKEPLIEPFCYGFIKGTMSGDGDPLDVFVMSGRHISAGDEVNAEPIGVLYSEDEMGDDNKIIAVEKYDKTYGSMIDISQVDKRLIYALLYQIEHNKDGLEGKFTRIKGIGNAEEAKAAIEKASKQ